MERTFDLISLGYWWPGMRKSKINIYFYTDMEKSGTSHTPQNGSSHLRVRATAVQGNKSCLLHVITRNGNTNYWKNAEVFALHLVVRRLMLTTRLKGDTLKEMIKEGTDSAGVSSFYKVIKLRIL
jgi:hypothetical protein